MTLFFESTDLISASPATISRCGVIYFKPESLGYETFFESWKIKNSEFGKYALKVINSFF
jgi:dynein heavy chain